MNDGMRFPGSKCCTRASQKWLQFRDSRLYVVACLSLGEGENIYRLKIEWYISNPDDNPLNHITTTLVVLFS